MRADSYAGDDVGGTRRSSQKTDTKTSKSREFAGRRFVLFSTANPTAGSEAFLPIGTTRLRKWYNAVTRLIM